MKKFALALIAAVAMLATSCGGAKIEIDNPTGESITVTIDGKKEYALAPKELLAVKGLKNGAHTMSVDGGAEIPFTIEGSALINPTLSAYVTDVQEYSESAGEMATDDWVTVELDGEEYWGPIELFEGPVIPLGDINFGVLTDFPEEIESYKSGATRMKKLFRAADYPAYYEQAYQ